LTINSSIDSKIFIFTQRRKNSDKRTLTFYSIFVKIT